MEMNHKKELKKKKDGKDIISKEAEPYSKGIETESIFK